MANPDRNNPAPIIRSADLSPPVLQTTLQTSLSDLSISHGSSRRSRFSLHCRIAHSRTGEKVHSPSAEAA